MRFNNWIKDNDIRKDYTPYFMMAGVLAFAFYFFINLIVKLSIIVFKILYKYWWATALIFLIIIFFKIKKRKKRK